MVNAILKDCGSVNGLSLPLFFHVFLILQVIEFPAFATMRAKYILIRASSRPLLG
jgi:hypothetical protein